MKSPIDKPILEAQISKKDIGSILQIVKGRLFVYLLLQGRTPVYVGMTSSLLSRLRSHKQSKPFDAVYLCEYSDKQLCSVNERRLIRYFSPKYNHRCIP